MLWRFCILYSCILFWLKARLWVMVSMKTLSCKLCTSASFCKCCLSSYHNSYNEAHQNNEKECLHSPSFNVLGNKPIWKRKKEKNGIRQMVENELKKKDSKRTTWPTLVLTFIQRGSSYCFTVGFFLSCCWKFRCWVKSSGFSCFSLDKYHTNIIPI